MWRELTLDEDASPSRFRRRKVTGLPEKERAEMDVDDDDGCVEKRPPKDEKAASAVEVEDADGPANKSSVGFGMSSNTFIQVSVASSDRL